jgi:phage-related tail fiber protein
MAFYTILTDIGKAKLANATALGTVVSLTEIAVGDGGGVVTSPKTTDTSLVNEVWRAALNNISIDSNNANWIVAEGYIPSTDGNFTVREVGLFDFDGDMIAVGNYPDTYKPTLDTGSAKDLYIKVIIEVSDADVVELKIDPSVVLATRKFVEDGFYTKEETDLMVGDFSNKNLVQNIIVAENENKAMVNPVSFDSLTIDENGVFKLI